jgi:hypothetical protein
MDIFILLAACACALVAQTLQVISPYSSHVSAGGWAVGNAKCLLYVIVGLILRRQRPGNPVGGSVIAVGFAGWTVVPEATEPLSASPRQHGPVWRRLPVRCSRGERHLAREAMLPSGAHTVSTTPLGGSAQRPEGPLGTRSDPVHARISHTFGQRNAGTVTDSALRSCHEQVTETLGGSRFRDASDADLSMDHQR